MGSKENTEESVLKAEMQNSIVTKQHLYSEIISKNLTVAGSKQVRLQNILMQMRKCCNHPYLFDWPLDSSGHEAVDEALVQASGKMQLLDRILKRLIKDDKEKSHQVLIFSQMTRMLDILEEYLIMRSYQFRRLDGTVAAEDRMSAMRDFQ